ncbi:molybdopterin-dependent oxidoreductase [Desulfitobacterium sp. PCE1]|uniref:molybdopterin-dependent oxidoreductase n=1 Tax=Desulfitobacterium sp. PCE1 TaxID=146907 RepID=UPI00037ABB25|nr:molybdopterin-dependent oxidoreductase [Desulfitobacterium sp. PCE1]
MATKQLPPQLEETAESSHITLVVSHPWLQEAFMRLLQDAGITVSVMAAPEELLEGVDETVDIVMVDVMAYQSQYRQLFEMMRQKHPGLLIIALLSEHTAYHASNVAGAGANGIVIKENADTELLSALYSTLSGSRITKISSRLLNAVKKCEAMQEEEVAKLIEKKELEEKDDGGLLGSKFGRRSFLKGTAAAAAMVGVTTSVPGGLTNMLSPVSAQASENPEEKVYAVSCRSNCFSGCHLNATVRNGKLVKTEMREFPDPEYSRACLKGLSHVQRVYDPDRLKKPMRRAGKRGEGQWEEISWDEAINEICTKWKAIRSQYGDSAVSFASLSGCFGINSWYSYQPLMNLMNASSFAHNVDAAYAYTAFTVFGLGPFNCGNETKDIKNARSIIVWGSNPAEAQIQSWHFFAEAIDNGATMIVIDPNYTITASKAKHFVPVNPATDGILAMAMINLIIEEDWVDWDFVKKSSVGPFWVIESEDKDLDGLFLRTSHFRPLQEGEEDTILVRDANGNFASPQSISDPVVEGAEHIELLKDGVKIAVKVETAYAKLKKAIAAYTLADAVKACGVDEAMIREITRIYATQGPSIIYNGYGPDHYTNGHQAVFAITALAILTGNAGKKGAFAGNPGNAALFLNYGAAVPDGIATKSPVINSIVGPDTIKNKKYGDIPVDVKSLYVSCGNMIGNWPDRNAWLEAFEQLELVVVADMTMSDTAMYADIVLPVCHWFEMSDILTTVTQHPYMLLSEKAIEPLYESKTDWDIIALLGRGMGYEKYFNKTGDEFVKEFVFGAPQSMRALGVPENVTWDNLMKEKALRVLPGDNYIHGENGVFPTAHGRAQFYLERPYPIGGFYGQEVDLVKERLPYWEPATEVFADNPLKEKYPLSLIQGHSRFRTHTQWGLGVPWLNELITKHSEKEPSVQLNPLDARARGLQEGDLVKLYNDRGYVVVKAILNDGIRPGTLLMYKGWQRDQFIEGHYQNLTLSKAHGFCANSPYFDVLVEVELYKGGKH